MRFILALIFLLLSSSIFGQNIEKKAFKNAICQQDSISLQKRTALKLKPYYSNATYTYYRLLLANLPKNALLITNSENDTYPIRIIQILEKNRLDVTVISLKLTENENYRLFVNSSYKLKLQQGDPRSNIQQILKKYPNTFFSVTVNQSYWRNYYLNGLHVAVLNENTNQKLGIFYQTYLKYNVLNMNLTNSDKLLYKNLLPPLITLYKTDTTVLKLKKDILLLAEKLAMEAEVKLILENE